MFDAFDLENREDAEKVEQIKIDRVAMAKVDPAILPKDAEFKGYEEVVAQDIKITTESILFRQEKYYSPSAGKTHLAKLPPGYDYEFGPGVKALVINLYFRGKMTQSDILRFLEYMGCHPSPDQLSNFLLDYCLRYYWK